VNLVTGATGILGSHMLLELLLNGEEVVACKQENSNVLQVEKLFSYYVSDFKTLFLKIKWVVVDIRDIFSIEVALEGIHTVYHCAGLVSFDKKDKKKLYEINVQGTANIVNACLSKKTAALCHVSSIGAINNADYKLPLHEGVFWKTSGRESDYAISKYNGEREVWRGVEEGLSAVIVNPGVILSPGFWTQSSSRIVETCYNGNRFYTSGVTGYIAAGDVSKIMYALINMRKFHNRYVLIENNYSFKHIFDCIHSGLKKPVPSFKVSKTLMQLAGYINGFVSLFTGKPPRINKSIINAAFNQQSYTNKKIRETLNFNFIPVDLAIDQICKHYLFEKLKDHSSS